MGPEAAVNAVCANKLPAIDDEAERAAFVAPEHAGRERPCEFEIAGIVLVDLIELGIPLACVIARLQSPVCRVSRVRHGILIGSRGRSRAR